MCGIAGFIGTKRNWREDINGMISALSHRGPDGSGIWQDNSGIVLGHTRLAILDLSDNGNQPMVSDDGRFVLTFNGEIYNYKELRKELRDVVGYHFHGQSDTEVLLAAFDSYGIDKTLEKIIGMFGIALYDRQNKELFLARDRMGEKPLYYGNVKGSFVWASELSAICRFTGFEQEIDEKVLPVYFRHGYIPSPYSIYKGIYKLEPGNCMRVGIDGKTIRKWKYWDILSIASQNENVFAKISGEEALSIFEKMLRDSIRKQLRSDVPIGLYLSGGIDSCMIATIASQSVESIINTFSIGFTEKKYDESHYSRRIAEYLGTRHEEWIVQKSDLIDVMPKMADIYQEPFADNSQLPSFLLSQMAKKKVTVVLSGDGGDELCYGYSRYSELTALHQEILNNNKGAMHYAGISKYKKSIYLRANGIEQMYRDYFLWGEEVQHICHCSTGKKSPIDAYPEGLMGCDENNLMLMDQIMYLPDDILTKVDRSGMAVSLENRIPLLDHILVEFMWKIPLNLKNNGAEQKFLFKKLLAKNLPSDLWDHEKKGFNIPMKELFADRKLREWVTDLLSPIKLKSEGYLDEFVVSKLWNDYEKKGAWKPQIWYIIVFENFLEEILKKH